MLGLKNFMHIQEIALSDSLAVSHMSFFGSLLLFCLVIKSSKCTSTKNLCRSG